MPKTITTNLYKAESILLNQHLFKLSQENFLAFEAALATPLPENTELKALLQVPSPWEK